MLADEQEIARRLLHMFDDKQRDVVVYADEPPVDIETREIVQVEPGPPRGLSVREMDEGQSDLLMQLVEEYAYRIRPELADAELAEIRRAGVEEIHFGWAGGDEFGEPHYYRVQGPTFLIEYDNRQNGANHIHSVWRDLTGDFGQDLLSQHYSQSPHHNFRDTYALAGVR